MRCMLSLVRLSSGQDEFEPDVFVDNLLRQVSVGRNSLTGICESARAVVWSQHGNCARSIIQLGRCGNWGRCPQNVERDVHAFAQRYFAFGIEPYLVPIRVDAGRGEEIMQLPMYPVHEYLAALWGCGQDTCAVSCFSSDGFASLARFWNHVSHMPWAQSHPAQADQLRMPYTIPACLFGDDAKLYKNEKMIVWELSFLLSKAPTVVSKFIIGVLPYWLIIPEKTLQDAHSAIRWMWAEALAGQYATVDHLGRAITVEHGKRRWARRGTPLCSTEPRFRIAFVGLKADLQYEKLTLNFRSYDQHEMCRDCGAHKMDPARLYTEIGPAARWRELLRTDQEFLRDQGEKLCELCLIPGWTRSLHRYDPMHVIFLGIALHVIGSVLMELVQRRYWLGATKKEGYRNAWRLTGRNCLYA